MDKRIFSTPLSLVKYALLEPPTNSQSSDHRTALGKRMTCATNCHCLANSICGAGLVLRSGDPLIDIEVETGGILVSIRTVENAVPQDPHGDYECDA